MAEVSGSASRSSGAMPASARAMSMVARRRRCIGECRLDADVRGGGEDRAGPGVQARLGLGAGSGGPAAGGNATGDGEESMREGGAGAGGLNTSISGGGVSPRAIASSVAPPRTGLPRSNWWTLSASVRSAVASIASVRVCRAGSACRGWRHRWAGPCPWPACCWGKWWGAAPGRRRHCWRGQIRRWSSMCPACR